MHSVKLAILDMYEGTPNQGMRCIQDIVRRFEPVLEWELFDVRGKAEVPGMDFDLYISTGGPGSPHEGDGTWDVMYHDWLRQTWEWNQMPGNPKKHVFFICHSFQMAVLHFGLAEVTRRKSMSFGTFRCHMTDLGVAEPLFDGLPNPFYIADFREWQCIQPDEERFEQMGAKILALEKIRPHVPLERALMAIRFSDEFFGVQFHPEADPDGMLDHFLSPERRKHIVETHSQEKYLRMIEHLNDPDKIGLTHDVVLPQFLNRAIRAVQGEMAMV
ncbi:MAG: GMP synthase [Phaeodactylibacter sp.]|nr:GMP synthase [Phaeodactylibacter sp.]MCB9296595.1 GMP synthase [Lewinellaceae bacterium]